MSANACWAIVAAAGSGRRFGASLPKQYATLGGRTVLEHSLEAVCASSTVTTIVLVLAPDDPIWPQLELKLDARVRVVVGGTERANSVLNALHAIAAEARDDDWVLVHDAARPCVRAEGIDALLAELADDPVGGLWALPVVDTVKRVEEGRVVGTVPRDNLWRAQTPQVFRYGLLTRALQEMVALNRPVTDEAAAIEYLGYRPRIVAGSANNLKITRQEDLLLAAFYLQQVSSLQVQGES